MRDITARWMALIALIAAVAGGGGYALADTPTGPPGAPPPTPHPPTLEETLTAQVVHLYAENAEMKTQLACFGTQRRAHHQKPIVIWKCGTR